MICVFRGSRATVLFSGLLQDPQEEKLDDADGNAVGHRAQGLAKEEIPGEKICSAVSSCAWNGDAHQLLGVKWVKKRSFHLCIVKDSKHTDGFRKYLNNIFCVMWYNGTPAPVREVWVE